MRNTGLMVIAMISSKTEKQKTESHVMPVVILAVGQRQAAVNLLKVVWGHMLMNQQQLANVQAVHGKGHWWRRELVVRLRALKSLLHGKHCH